MWWLRPSEALHLPRVGSRETQAQLLLPTWLPRWGTPAQAAFPKPQAPELVQLPQCLLPCTLPRMAPLVGWDWQVRGLGPQCNLFLWEVLMSCPN